MRQLPEVHVLKVACREVFACKQEVALGKGAVCKEELSLKEEIAWEKGYVFRSR